MTVHGSCLCGDVAWEADEPLDLMSHCHCSRCRKVHGAAFATGVACDADRFRFTRGRDGVERYASSTAVTRPFCGRCGSVMPDDESPWMGKLFVAAGALDDDPGVRPLAHIFVASKAPWFEIRDGLPTFDAYPPDIDIATLPDLPAPLPDGGKLRGSCLCRGVAFEVEGPLLRAYHCHCSRCRKARAAAFASNLFTTADGVRMVRGEDLLRSYKVPEARYFMQVFCLRCGASAPRRDPERNLTVIPMSALDDDPGIRPERHIFVGSKAPWYEIADDLPQDAAAPSPR